MSISSSIYSGLEGKKKQIEDWLQKICPTYSYNLERIQDYPYWSINMNGSDVNLFGFKNSELPDYIVFNEIIGGNFIASYSEFTSMRGFPKKVGKNFDISFSKISSLDNAPQLVDKDFVACGCPFTKRVIEAKTKVTCKVYA